MVQQGLVNTEEITGSWEGWETKLGAAVRKAFGLPYRVAVRVGEKVLAVGRSRLSHRSLVRRSGFLCFQE